MAGPNARPDRPSRWAEVQPEQEDAIPILYSGCWQRVGHFCFLPGMKSWNGPNWNGIGPFKYLDSKELHPLTDVTGDAMVTHKAGWTALGIEDRTVDSRGNSNSVFAMKGTYSFDEALAIARRYFPQIIERIGEVREAEPSAAWRREIERRKRRNASGQSGANPAVRSRALGAEENR